MNIIFVGAIFASRPRVRPSSATAIPRGTCWIGWAAKGTPCGIGWSIGGRSCGTKKWGRDMSIQANR